MALDVPLDAKNFFQHTVGKKSDTSRDFGSRASDIGQTFQDRLVMTTSISLRGYLLRRFSYFRENFARELFNFCALENPRSPYVARIFEGTE